jgi:hypothetical protein
MLVAAKGPCARADEVRSPAHARGYYRYSGGVRAALTRVVHRGSRPVGKSPRPLSPLAESRRDFKLCLRLPSQPHDHHVQAAVQASFRSFLPVSTALAQPSNAQIPASSLDHGLVSTTTPVLSRSHVAQRRHQRQVNGKPSRAPTRRCPSCGRRRLSCPCCHRRSRASYRQPSAVFALYGGHQEHRLRHRLRLRLLSPWLWLKTRPCPHTVTPRPHTVIPARIHSPPTACTDGTVGARSRSSPPSRG